MKVLRYANVIFTFKYVATSDDDIISLSCLASSNELELAYFNCLNCDEEKNCLACDNGFMHENHCLSNCPDGLYGVIEYDD